MQEERKYQSYDLLYLYLTYLILTETCMIVEQVESWHDDARAAEKRGSGDVRRARLTPPRTATAKHVVAHPELYHPRI